MPADSRTIPLFLDCDPGIDDAIALAYLLCQSDVDVIGIAASGGNVATEQVVRNALGWLRLAGRDDIPVHPGAEFPLALQTDPASGAGSTGIGSAGAASADPAPAAAEPATDPEFAEVTHGDTGSGYARLPDPTTAPSDLDAAEAWVRAARQHPGELIGVVIGPSTNLALALRLDPELPKLLRRLFIMGGAFNYRGNTHPTTEWNITYDPEAAAQVLSAFGASEHLPVIGPIEATEAVTMTPTRLDGILAAPVDPAWHEVLVQLGEALRFYFEFHESDGHGYLAHIHDPYVLAAAIEWARGGSDAAVPWAETRTAPVDVELTGTLTRGETVADWLGRWNRPANAEIIRRIEADDFLDHLTASLQKGPDHDHTR